MIFTRKLVVEFGEFESRSTNAPFMGQSPEYRLRFKVNGKRCDIRRRSPSWIFDKHNRESLIEEVNLKFLTRRGRKELRSL